MQRFGNIVQLLVSTISVAAIPRNKPSESRYRSREQEPLL
jgi:hypothetical protein